MARTGLARALSKLGHCSRSQGVALVRAGRVRLNDKVCRDPEKPVLLDQDVIAVDGGTLAASAPVYLMLNKPRGLVTTAQDEQGRDTVFRCLDGSGLPHLSPVGRLDKASEGLLLFTNDNVWADRVTDPATHLEKTYHVQAACVADKALMERLRRGVVDAATGEHLSIRRAKVLRAGEKNTWLEIVLDEGRNRHIRRVLEALGLEVLRLVRVAVGTLPLGKLDKGAWRQLTAKEAAALRGLPPAGE